MSALKLMAVAGSLCVAAFSSSALEAQVRLKAGQWEYAATRGGQTSTHTICLTAAQADTVNGSAALIRTQLEKSIPKGQNCKLTDLKVDARSQSATIDCGTSSITNVMTFHDGETAENTMTTRAEGKEYVATLKMKRLGACPASSK